MTVPSTGQGRRPLLEAKFLERVSSTAVEVVFPPLDADLPPDLGFAVA